MSMKKTDLEKNKAIKLREGVQKAPVPTRFGVASTAVPDRREQRRLDQAAGLVPFACKLKDELVQRLRALAEAEARRQQNKAADLPPELGGRDGPEPVRYGDWEKKGLTSDF